MLTRKQAAEQRRALRRDIEREHRRKAGARLTELRAQLHAARAERKTKILEAKQRCRSERLAARERAHALRVRALAELREAMRIEREAARSACSVQKNQVRASGADAVARARAELEAEKKYQRDLRRIERSNRAALRSTPRATARERRGESDDAVRANIPPDLVPLFEKVKRGIKAGPRESRTEAFLRYAEEHPHEVLEIIDDKTEALIQRLEREQRQVHRSMKRPPRARGRTPALSSAEVPF